MDLELSDDEAGLRDNVRSVLSGICPPGAVREVFEGRADGSGIWSTMVELCWPGLAIAERHGGLGLGFVEVALVAEELGRVVAPGPFLATVTQFAPLVREVGGDAAPVADLLAGVAAGTLTGSAAVAERGSWEPGAVRATARPVADGWELAGSKHAVLHADSVDVLAVVARAVDGSGTDGPGLFVVDSDAVTVTGRDAPDPTLRTGDVLLDGVVVPPDRVLAVPGTAGAAEAIGRANEEAMVALAAATAGTCRALFEMTLEYTKVREQFGRPIGSFQALKHRLADLYLAVERATALCYYAALTIAEDDPRRSMAARMAKAAAGECQRAVVRDGLQLHGGIGMTWEHDLHLWLKRAVAGDALYGNAIHQRSRLGGQLGLLSPSGTAEEAA